VKVRERILWVGTLLVACEAPTASNAGVILVDGAVSGGSDPNGFEVIVDRRAAVPFDGTGPLIFAPVSPGTHRVELAGLSGNCRSDGPDSREVVVGDGDTAAVT